MSEDKTRRNFIKGMGTLLSASAISIPASAKVIKELSLPESLAPVINSKRDTIINSYYYAPHNHSLLTRHLDYDLEKMKSIGTDIVTFCIQEGQLTNWHFKRVQNTIDRIHHFGMKAHALPNRWAGLTAGWLDGFSEWSIKNRDTWLVSDAADAIASSDPLNPKVAAWYKKNLDIMFNNFDFDGLLWDEPRPFENLDVFFFLNDMSAYIKKIKPDAMISMFAESTCLHLGTTFPKLNHIEYLGSDGHVRSNDHQMKRMKTTIFTAHDVFYKSLTAAGRKTFFLLEAQRHRDEDLQNYLENIQKAVELPMDQLMYYYSAHEMSTKNEKTFNDATWKAIASIKGIKYKS